MGRASMDTAHAFFVLRPTFFVTYRRAIHSAQRFLPSERPKKSAGPTKIVTRPVKMEAGRAEMQALWTKKPDDVVFFDYETRQRLNGCL